MNTNTLALWVWRRFVLILSGVPFLAMLILCILSYFVPFLLVYSRSFPREYRIQSPAEVLDVCSERGVVDIVYIRRRLVTKDGHRIDFLLHDGQWRLSSPQLFPKNLSIWNLRHYRFKYSNARLGPTPSAPYVTDFPVIVIPYWSILLISCIMPVLWLIRRAAHRRRLRRALAGLCSHCGYDLRGSVVRCPECGAPIAKAANSGA